MPSQKPKAASEREFDIPVTVMYVLTGGVVFEVSGVVKIEKTENNALILTKTDQTYTEINPDSWLAYDVQGA